MELPWNKSDEFESSGFLSNELRSKKELSDLRLRMAGMVLKMVTGKEVGEWQLYDMESFHQEQVCSPCIRVFI